MTPALLLTLLCAAGAPAPSSAPAEPKRAGSHGADPLEEERRIRALNRQVTELAPLLADAEADLALGRPLRLFTALGAAGAAVGTGVWLGPEHPAPVGLASLSFALGAEAAAEAFVGGAPACAGALAGEEPETLEARLARARRFERCAHDAEQQDEALRWALGGADLLAAVGASAVAFALPAEDRRLGHAIAPSLLLGIAVARLLPTPAELLARRWRGARGPPLPAAAPLPPASGAPPPIP